MQTYKLLVKNRSVKANSDDTTLVRTSIGVDQIHVMFDNAEWLSFPITATLAMGKKIVSTPITLRDISGSDQWVAESTFTIPWEVMQTVGALRVTFQGTDQEGNHIITAYGAPLRVEESGDVMMGDIPESAPTVSQYEQAYARAVQMLSEIDSALRTLGDVVRKSDIATIESPGIVKPDGVTIVINSEGSISTVDGYVLVPATESSLGGVIPDGESITIDHDGTIHASISYELPTANSARLGGIRIGNGLKVTPSGVASVDEQFVESHAGHVDIATDEAPGVVKPDGDTITIDADGTIHGTDVVPIATESVPGKVMPDGDTITIDVDGTIHGHGKNGFEGLVGRYGYVGNSGYDKSAYILGDESDGAYVFPMVTNVGANAYRSCKSLVSVEFPSCSNIEGHAFHNCTSLEKAEFPKCSSIGGYAFSYCTKLSEARFPSCRTVGYDAFWNCSRLTSISLPMVSYISGYAFESCVRLTKLDLTGVTSVPSLVTTAFNYTPISTYTTVTSGSYGSIFVPSSLYSRFISAIGWSLFSRRMVSA